MKFIARTVFVSLCVAAGCMPWGFSETSSSAAWGNALRTGSGETVNPDVAPELEARLTPQWDEASQTLLVRSSVANTGAQPLSVPQVEVFHRDIQLSDTPDGGRYRALSFRNDQWYGSTYWGGPDWTRVGRDWHHPGENTPSVRRFIAPRDGRVTVTGHVFKADTKCGDGVRVCIRRNAETVWDAELDAADTAGVEHAVVLDVRKGDALRFAVAKRGEIACDTTRWNPRIAYEDGEAFLASEGFSEKEACGSTWGYEMEVRPDATDRWPRVHAMDMDGWLVERTVAPGQTVQFGATDTLPIIIVSDDSDTSGIAFAMTPATAWTFEAALSEAGVLSVRWSAAPDETIAPGASAALPQTLAGVYRGAWSAGMAWTRQALETMPEMTPLRERIAGVFESVEGVDYWTMLQEDWRRADRVEDTVDSLTAAAATQRERARRLLDDIGSAIPEEMSKRLEECAQAAAPETLQEARRAYLRAHLIKRDIALANPLFPDCPILFCKRVPTSYSHLVMQYYGWRARSGGGLYVLDRPGHSLEVHPLLPAVYATGNVLEPRLSYDAQRIVFSYVANAGKEYDYLQLNNNVDVAFYHIYEIATDGSGLRQITTGPFDDVMPAYLPDGGIVFSSTRRMGYARCFGAQFSPRWHVYTLHRMDADGGNLHALSYHDTNEWFPAVAHDGRIVYSRWDYIDRDAVTHQNLWATRPDGTGTVTVWGNATASPHCTFQAQPIPGTEKFVFTASAHHSIAGGSLAIVTPSEGYDGQQPIQRLTPEIPFPEAEGRDIKEYYTSPWPLSERYFLTAYSPEPLVWEPGANGVNALGLYLFDADGNRELLYRDPEIGCENPCPLRPRPVPPVLPSELPANPPDTGELVLTDVYRGLGPEATPGSIKELRIVQIFPKGTPVGGTPPIGLALEENGRAVLGTVPVEADGSARFTVPARKPLLFQALDEHGVAFQTMRTTAYLQPGERLSCAGCHENRMSAAPSKPSEAMQRPPSTIAPGAFGGQPFSFMRVVQPVLDKHCVRCHSGEKPPKGIDLTATPQDAYTRSYVSLCNDVNFWEGGTNPENAAKALVPRFGGRNQVQVTPPGGQYGARGSRLLKHLRAGHVPALEEDDFRRIAMWIDLNAIFYGVNAPDTQTAQLHGEIVPMPALQ